MDRLTSLLFASIVVSSALILSVPAGAAPAHKMAAVYVCKMCKAYFSAADAKKMHYKDPMGHKLTKASKAPAGYKMMHAGAMDGKMKAGKM